MMAKDFWTTVAAVAIGTAIGGTLALPSAIFAVDLMIRFNAIF